MEMIHSLRSNVWGERGGRGMQGQPCTHRQPLGLAFEVPLPCGSLPVILLMMASPSSLGSLGLPAPTMKTPAALRAYPAHLAASGRFLHTLPPPAPLQTLKGPGW